MFYIINKSDKQIQWANPAENIDSPEHIWAGYNPLTQYPVKSDILRSIGQDFPYPLQSNPDGIYTVIPFNPITVYNKITGIRRVILTYLDPAQTEEETTIAPIENYPLDLQKFNGTAWFYDTDKLMLKIKPEILAYLENILSEGTLINGHIYQCREEDILRMNLAVSNVAIGGVWAGAWRDAGNQWNPMSFDDFKSLALQAGSFYQSSFVKSRELIDGLQLLSDTELANYNIDERWNA